MQSQFQTLVLNYRKAETEYIKRRTEKTIFSDPYIKMLVEKETAFEFANKCRASPKIMFDKPFEIPQKLSKASLVRACVNILAKQLKNCVFFLQKSQRIEADVIYIRKKVQPDSVPLEDIETQLRRSGIRFKAVHQNFGWGASKHGISFVNGIPTFGLFLVSQLRIIKIFWLYRHEISKYLHKENKMENLYDSLLQMQLLALLKPKVLVGTFSDKPYFCLLKKVIEPEQQTISMLDGFIFPQLSEIKYTVADIVLLKCHEEISLIDHQKNLLSSVKVIGALDLTSTPTGRLSPEISNIPLARKRVLVALMQIDPPFWDKEFHINFLHQLLDCITQKRDVQFVLKEKKGELSEIPNSLLNKLIAKPNCLIIRSKSPKLQIENKFIDLICWADVLISQSTNSMTIFEAIKHNKEVIAYDLLDNSSFWQKQNSGVIYGCDLAKLLDQALHKHPNNSPSGLKDDLHLDAKANFCKVIADAIKR